MLSVMGADETQEVIPGWVKAVSVLAFGLFVVFNMIYRFGYGGVEVSGANVSFNRQYDNALFRIDDQLAFVVSGGGMASVVRYEPGMVPFRPLCGSYDLAGTVVHGRFKKGDWIYRDSYSGFGATAFNLATKEEVKLQMPAGAGDTINPADVPLYVKHGLTFDDDNKLTVEWVVDEHEPIAVINESCLTFNAAFMLIFAALFLTTVVAVPLRLWRRKR